MSFPNPTRVIPDVCAVPLSDLILVYRESIDMLRNSLKNEIEAHKRVEKADPNFGDDIFLLRYILSHHKKGLEKCKQFVIKTMEWRKKYADVLLPLRRDLADVNCDDKIRPYMPGGLHYNTLDGHPLFLVRNGIANPHLVMKTGITSEQLSEWMVLTKECSHAYCDAQSRLLNRLIKIVSIQDFKYSSMKAFNRGFMAGVTSSSHVSESVYPQLLKKSVIVNMPYLLKKVTALTLKLLPHGLQEKIALCQETDPARIAAFVSKEFNIPLHELPTFLGGECTCDGEGCANNTPNTIDHMITDEDIKKFPAKMDEWPQYISKRLGQCPVSQKKEVPWPFKYVDESSGIELDDTLSGFISTIHPKFNVMMSLVGDYYAKKSLSDLSSASPAAAAAAGDVAVAEVTGDALAAAVGGAAAAETTEEEEEATSGDVDVDEKVLGDVVAAVNEAMKAEEAARVVIR